MLFEVFIKLANFAFVLIIWQKYLIMELLKVALVMVFYKLNYNLLAIYFLNLVIMALHLFFKSVVVGFFVNHLYHSFYVPVQYKSRHHTSCLHYIHLQGYYYYLYYGPFQYEYLHFMVVSHIFSYIVEIQF